MAASERVLLLEIVNADQFPGRISCLYPFLDGWLARHGVPRRWIRFAVPTTNLLENWRDEITLDAAAWARLDGLARELRPTRVVATDPLHRPGGTPLLPEVPGVRVELEAEFAGLPGLPAFVRTEELADPDFEPGYAWEPGNEAALRREIDNVYVALRERCGHSRHPARAPPYAGLPDPRIEGHRGCTFCSNWRDPRGIDAGGGQTPPDWIDRQIRAIARSRGSPERFPHAVLLTVVPTPRLLERCLASMREAGLVPATRLLFAIRTDQIPAAARVLHEAFAAADGLRAGVYASGIESFDAADLALYNKGTTPLDGVRAVNTYRDLAARYPGRFTYTGLSFLLFTPWSTIEGLHLNFGLIRFLEMGGDEAGNPFQARLRLHPELAITALAEAGGFVVAEETDPVLVMNRRKLFGAEQPWRFADERLRPISRLVLRYDLLDTPLADPLARSVERRVREVDPDWRPGGVPALAELTSAQLEEALHSPAPLDEETLLGRAVERWRSARARRAEAPAARFRIGEERVDLAGLLARLAPLVREGIAPLVAIRGVSRHEVGVAAAALSRASLHHATVDREGRPAPEGTLLIAIRADDLTRRAACEAPLWGEDADARSAAVREAGRLHGIPACCAEARAHGPLPAPGASRWAAMAALASADAPAPAAFAPGFVPSIGFVPCAPGCERAVEVLAARHQAIGCVPPDAADAVHVFELDGAGDGELVVLRPASPGSEEVRYDPATVAPGPGTLRARLRGADALELVPGQIRLRRGGALVDLLTASHAVWCAARSWHGAFWEELARAKAGALRRSARGRVEAPARATAPGVEGSVVVRMTDRAAGSERYRFRVTHHRPGRPHYRRAGPLALSYEHAGLTRRSDSIASAILRAMHDLEPAALSPEGIDRWRGALDGALARAGIGDLELEVEWEARTR